MRISDKKRVYAYVFNGLLVGKTGNMPQDPSISMV